MKKVLLFTILAAGLTNCAKSCSGSGRDQLAKTGKNKEQITNATTQIPENVLPRKVEQRTDATLQEENIVFMKSRGGVTTIPVEINGTTFEFIFDTGASTICISTLEAALLIKNGLLSDEDFLGNQNYQTADGTIGEGTIVNLRSVKIGSMELQNVEATIINNPNAPLLLGQSALSRFGEFSVDYQNGRILFK